ncbi:sensor histidine kinase [Streptomyces sp. NPDC002851]
MRARSSLSRRAAVPDAVLAVLLTAVTVLGSWRAEQWQVPPRQELTWLGYALLVAVGGALAWRRTAPLAVFAATTLGGACYLALGFPHGPVVFPLGVAVFTVAARHPLRRAALALAVAVATQLSLWPTAPGPATHTTEVLLQLSALVWIALPWCIGAVLRVQRESSTRVRREEARRHASEERLDIAREVHDLVGHSLSVISMQAGIALHVSGKDPDAARTALASIRTTSKEALDELRSTLAVFREQERERSRNGSRSGTPHEEPTGRELTRLGTLAARMTDSGLRVDCRIDDVLESEELPAMVDRAAYRIVQEALTNVLRHSDADRAHVHVTRTEAGLDIEVTDEGRPRAPVGPPAAGSGFGLVGMRERCAALGGTLEYGPRGPDGAPGFHVHAYLPLGETGR